MSLIRKAIKRDTNIIPTNLNDYRLSTMPAINYRNIGKAIAEAAINSEKYNTGILKELEAKQLEARNFPLMNLMEKDSRIVEEEYGLEPKDYSLSEEMESDTTSKEGILQTLFKTLGSGAADYIRGGGMIGRGITSIANLFGDTFKGSRFYNPRTESGNRLFAPGARAGDRVGLGFRRDANRFANMLNRLAAGKTIGRTNLEKIMARQGLTGIDVGGMADSIAASAQTGYGGYGSRSAAAEAAASGGRDYSRSPGAMKGDMEYGEE